MTAFGLVWGTHCGRSKLIHPLSKLPVLSLCFPRPQTCLLLPFPHSYAAFEQPPSARCVSNCAVRVTFRFTILEEIAWIWICQNTKFNQPRGPSGAVGRSEGADLSLKLVLQNAGAGPSGSDFPAGQEEGKRIFNQPTFTSPYCQGLL